MRANRRQIVLKSALIKADWHDRCLNELYEIDFTIINFISTEFTFAGKDDVLYVDITMFQGVSGHWRAWKLDEYGHRLQCGIIPSQMK